MKPGIIQANGLYALTLEFASGMIDASLLNEINNIVKEEGATVHLTTAQKIMLLDLSEHSAKRAREKLDASGAHYKFPRQVYQPRVCVGSTHCKLGLRDTLRFGEDIYKNFAHAEIPYKLKIGVSGCPASCAHSTLSDIGFIAKKSGYSVYAGGKAGIHPEMGQLVGKGIQDDQGIKIIKNIIQLYRQNCDSNQKRQRIFHIIKTMGFDEFKTLIMKDGYPG